MEYWLLIFDFSSMDLKKERKKEKSWLEPDFQVDGVHTFSKSGGYLGLCLLWFSIMFPCAAIGMYAPCVPM